MNDSEAIEWCRKSLLIAGSPLAASLPYAPDDMRDQILALRAVVVEIARIADEVSEPEVARTRLAWWRRALRESLPHPAVQAWTASGAAGLANPETFDALVAGVDRTLCDPRFENREAAWQFCREVGGIAWVLEADLAGADDDVREIVMEFGAASYAIRLVRDLAIDARNHRWMAPLDLQASFQVSRRDALTGERPSAGWNGMVRAWLDDALGRCDRVKSGLDPEPAWRHRHLMIQHALDRRLALKLARRPERIIAGRVVPGQVGNAWCAWRAARRLRRARVNRR